MSVISKFLAPLKENPASLTFIVDGAEFHKESPKVTHVGLVSQAVISPELKDFVQGDWIKVERDRL